MIEVCAKSEKRAGYDGTCILFSDQKQSAVGKQVGISRIAGIESMYAAV